MKGITLSYEEKCQCSKDAFCSFLDTNSQFTEDEKNYLQQKIVNSKISGILYVIAVLAGWSFIAAWIDSLLIPGATIYSLIKGEVSIVAFAFPLSFLILNALFKFIYIRLSLKDNIPLLDNFVAVLPYVGSIYLLREYVAKDKLLSKAIKLFLKEQQNIIRRIIIGFFRIK